MGTTYTLTGGLGTIIQGGTSTVSAAYLRTNLPAGEALIDHTDTADGIKLGTGRIPLDAGGSFSINLLGTANTGLNVPANELRYAVYVEFGKPGEKGLFTWFSGWFELTADSDLGAPGFLDDAEPMAVASSSRYALEAKGYRDQAYAIAGADTADDLITVLDADAGSDFRVQQDARLSATIAALLGDVADPENVAALLAAAAVAQAIYGYEDHGDVSGNILIDPTTGTHVLDVAGLTLLTMGAAANGTMVAVRIKSGVTDVSWVDVTFEHDRPVEDPATVTLLRERNQWLAIGGSGGSGGGSPGTITATAPTADDTTNTYTIPAKTGVVYKVGGVTKAAGTHSVGNVTSSVLVTAVADSGYTIVGTASWNLIFTESLTWTTVAVDSFAGANGSSVTGRPLSGGTYTWAAVSAGNGPCTLSSNMAIFEPPAIYQSDSATYRLDPPPSPVSGVRSIEWKFDYVGTPNVSYWGVLNLRFGYRSTDYGTDTVAVTRLEIATSGAMSATAGALANDATQFAWIPVSGTTIPLSGRMRFEIIDSSAALYVDEVKTHTATFPGTLLSPSTWQWQVECRGGEVIKASNFSMRYAQ